MGMGGYHSCFVSTAGGLLCFGRNYEGQLGIGDTQDRGQCGTDYESITNLSVIDLGTDFNVTQIQIMGLHNCVLNDQEQLKCFGRYMLCSSSTLQCFHSVASLYIHTLIMFSSAGTTMEN